MKNVVRCLFFILLSVCLTLLIASCSNKVDNKVDNIDKEIVRIHGDYPVYKSISDLYGKADLVIEGKVIKTRVDLMRPVSQLSQEDQANAELYPGASGKLQERPFTIYTIEVQKVFKGNVTEKDTIEIKQIGGETDTKIFIEEGAPEIKVDTIYVMFLETYDNSQPTLLNNDQSLYRVENGELIPGPDNTLLMDYSQLNDL